jgi:hypothetical protein
LNVPNIKCPTALKIQQFSIVYPPRVKATHSGMDHSGMDHSGQEVMAGHGGMDMPKKHMCSMNVRQISISTDK